MIVSERPMMSEQRDEDDRTAERMAFLYGALLVLVDAGYAEARQKLREYQDHFDAVPRCRGALNIKGEHFECDLERGHDGLAHSSRAAGAIWGDDE